MLFLGISVEFCPLGFHIFLKHFVFKVSNTPYIVCCRKKTIVLDLRHSSFECIEKALLNSHLFLQC